MQNQYVLECVKYTLSQIDTQKQRTPTKAVDVLKSLFYAVFRLFEVASEESLECLAVTSFVAVALCRICVKRLGV